MKKDLPILLFFVCSISLASAQNFWEKSSLSIGHSVIAEYLPEGVQYEPFVILGAFTVWQRKNFSIYGEGQLTYLFNQLIKQPEYEIGFNGGVAYKIPIGPYLQLRGAIGSGPHYITMETRRQANGFIFSDNFELALSHPFKNKDFKISLRARYRHISNAGFKKPNGGIDNLILLLSIGGKLSP